MKTLLITPPFTQLNTPYPATAYIKGYLNTLGINSRQADLGLEVILDLFSKNGLQDIFSAPEVMSAQLSNNANHIYNLRDTYINTVDTVISFLQGHDDTMAYLISERNYLPEASKFQQLDDLDWAFGTMGIRDKARHICTLYLEDLGDFIMEAVDSHFGFSRYAEKLSMSALSFDELHENLQRDDSYITRLLVKRLDKHITAAKPDLICLSVPFPGNLFAALKCGQYIKDNHPQIKVAMGGGYPNTELRSVTDARLFDYVDFVTLDDGETPLRNLIQYLEDKRDLSMLKRTITRIDGEVQYVNGSLEGDVSQQNVGTPDYSDLLISEYISVIQLTNPMHRVWSDGRWNKLTMAHGCYWGKCTFCDISLDYIKNYESSSAKLIVDRMETIIEQTGERGFHFVDEAAPPSVMKALALEILHRQLSVSWWTNIRFEKSFHLDLCRLLAASGCIAVSGGLEVASDRLLKMIDKGVTVEQVAKVNHNFTRAGIMVHAYLMYGFPTQTDQETIDSLEVVRQMFEADILKSGFWHRFSMTAHSPVGLAPAKFKVEKLSDTGSFANNDLEYADPTGTDHDLYTAGLKKSIYNYMHGVGIEFGLSEWFDQTIPATTHPADLIEGFLKSNMRRAAQPENKLAWIGGPLSFTAEGGQGILSVYSKNDYCTIELESNLGSWIESLISSISQNNLITFGQLESQYLDAGFKDFTLFWYGEVMETLKDMGLLVL